MMQSSPPPSAGSPPLGNNSLPNPRKRPSVSTNISHNKRRKASFASSAGPASAHPLRQTSFPPEQASLLDEGSRQGSFSPSVISHGAGSSVVGGRGRKGKASSKQDGRTGNVKGSKKGGESGSGQANGDDDADAPEDDDDEGDNLDAVMEGGDAGGGKMSEQQKKLERDHIQMLMEAFDDEQSERYDIWRRVRLKKDVVRKIVNQSLSQSVPASIVTTTATSTKIFIGELVERAREVQEEWATAAEQFPSGRQNPRFSKADKGLVLPDEDTTAVSPRPSVSESDKGPLLPMHLREALRRYKKEREGGSVGFQGRSLHGVESTASRTGGRRLFR